MSIQEPDQNCVSSGDRGGFLILSDTERDWAGAGAGAGADHGDRLGVEHKRLRGALDALFRAVRCESVRPEHISTLVDIIVRNFRKKEPSVSWAQSAQEGGKDTEVDRELDCPGCNRFIAEPLTVACGHSYCRSCLQQAFLSKCKKCHEEIGAKQLLRANVLLCGLLEKWFPEEIQKTKRIAEVKGLLRSKHFSQALSLGTQLLQSGKFLFTFSHNVQPRYSHSFNSINKISLSTCNTACFTQLRLQNQHTNHHFFVILLWSVLWNEARLALRMRTLPCVTKDKSEQRMREPESCIRCFVTRVFSFIT